MIEKKTRTINNTSYRKTHIDKLLAHCASGHSVKSFSAALQIPSSMLQHWIDTRPDFKIAVQDAMIGRLYYWETQLTSTTDRTSRLIASDTIKEIKAEISSFENSANNVKPHVDVEELKMYLVHAVFQNQDTKNTEDTININGANIIFEDLIEHLNNNLK